MPRSILIVDDQTDILRILEREFRRRGDYSVVIASSPAEALEVMAKSTVELVISDVRLGNQNGFSLLQEVNQLHPGVGTMLMTAYRSPAYRQQADALGVAAFLEKPFPVDTLVTAVERFFEQRLVQAEAQRATETGQLNTMAHFKPQDLVQLFCLNGRNVRISLDPGNGKPVGYIYIQRGRVLDAEFQGKGGEEAFYDMMREPETILSLQDWDFEVTQTIPQGWEHLLIESARQADDPEYRAGDFDEDPTPPPPALPVLAEPFADFWQIAQMPVAK